MARILKLPILGGTSTGLTRADGSADMRPIAFLALINAAAILGMMPNVDGATTIVFLPGHQLVTSIQFDALAGMVWPDAVDADEGGVASTNGHAPPATRQLIATG